MKRRDIFDLVLLAALWGASFLFTRMAVPAFGALAIAELRVAVAALMLLPLLALRGGLSALRVRPLRIVLIGAVNTAIPFALFAWAVLSITAGLAAILNATAPLFTALVAWFWLRERRGDGIQGHLAAGWHVARRGFEAGQQLQRGPGAWESCGRSRSRCRATEASSS